MIKVKYTGSFRQDLNNLLFDNPSLKKNIDKSVKLFVNNPEDSRLKTHALKKRLKGKYAFSVTDDIRIVFEWLGKNNVRFLAIGPHYHVYSRNKKETN